MKRCISVFTNLLNHLVSFFVYLVSNVKDPDQRETDWKNAANHFVGNHKSCHHPNENPKRGRGRPRLDSSSNRTYWEWEEGKKDKKLLEVLQDLLTRTTPLLLKTQNERTQVNESLNKNIAFKRPKTSVFSTSNEGRALAAIGQKNDIHFETNFLQHYYPNLIPRENIEILRRDEEKRANLSEKRNTDYERRKKNHFRTIEREKHKETPGDYKSKKTEYAVSY